MSETIPQSEHKDEENREDEGENDELCGQLFDQLPDTVSSMWEIPQIYEFLCLAKGTLHIEHLSMYEIERMLLLPKASKQLSTVMTCLLSPSSLPISKYKYIPPMPYEFWTNYLLSHKVPSWFKVYENKEKDSVKVLDTIGIEPEFWKIFPDISLIEQRNFEDFEVKQRVWLLKTICDTLMHARKSLQEEIANKYLDGQSEKILGRDRFGARYIYFPIFLDGDLRVYKHFMNNKIFLNAMPVSAKLKLQSRRGRKKGSERKRAKNNRWKNGILPSRTKRRVRRVKKGVNPVIDSTKSEIIEQNTSDVGSSLEADLNKDVELNKDLMGAESKEAIMDIIGVKPYMVEETDDHQPLDEISNSSKTDDEKMNEIMCSTPDKNNCEVSKSDDEKLIETKTAVVSDMDIETTNNVDNVVDNHLSEAMHEVNENDENTSSDEKAHDDEKIQDNEKAQDVEKVQDEEKSQADEKIQDEEKIEVDVKEEHEDIKHNIIINEGIKTRSKVCKKEIENFHNILTDLELSKFQLVADSVDSLRNLVENISNHSTVKSNEAVRCELLLLRKLKSLIQSLESKESYLKESTDRAKEKLQIEWEAFTKGDIKNEEPSDDDTHKPVAWILGSQGNPLLSCNDVQQRLEDEGSEKPKVNEGDEKNVENETKEEQETRRVLRARGVSSYIEQYSTDDESNSSQPEDWVGFETVDPSTGFHVSPHLPSPVTKTTRSTAGESDATDSDKDWILPSSRKRKKRSSASKRLKALQNKVQNARVDSNAGMIINESGKPPANTEIITNANDNIINQSDHCNGTLNQIKIESVHSVLDIKDEGPIMENQASGDNASGGVQQNYVLVNAGNGPVNYVVMKQENPALNPTSPVISIVPQVPVHSGYYVQNPQGYLVANPQITNVQSSYNEHANIPPMVMHPNQNYGGPPNNYLQYQKLGVMPPGMYPNPYPGPVPNTPVTVSMHSRPLPRVVQNRSIVLPPPRPRHPQGAVIRSTIPFRGTVRAPTVGRGRMPTPRIPNAPRQVRPTLRLQLLNPGNQAINPNKSTSLIVLSDDDDEIEMIIPQKSNAPDAKSPTVNNRIINKSKPTNANTADALSDKGGLSPQIIERMNQGGISITPVKRKSPEKQQPISATQLVVVVNETGSHYALSLPNGSKLILTPEQVAQIRASNGGKLIL